MKQPIEYFDPRPAVGGPDELGCANTLPAQRQRNPGVALADRARPVDRREVPEPVQPGQRFAPPTGSTCQERRTGLAR